MADSRWSSVTESLLVDQLTGFGTRHALVAELGVAVLPSSPPTLFVLFALEGYDEYVVLHGRLAGRSLVAKLGKRLQRALPPTARLYRSRQDELAAIVETTVEAASSLLDAAVAALRVRVGTTVISAAWGAALLPAEAADPVAALSLGEARLAATAPRPPRNRRDPGASRD